MKSGQHLRRGCKYKKGESIGVGMQLVVELAHDWLGKERTDSSSLQDMQAESGQGHKDLEDKLTFRASQTRWVSSQRASRWEEREALSTGNLINIYYPWNVK